MHRNFSLNVQVVIEHQIRLRQGKHLVLGSLENDVTDSIATLVPDNMQYYARCIINIANHCFSRFTMMLVVIEHIGKYVLLPIPSLLDLYAINAYAVLPGNRNISILMTMVLVGR